MGVLITILSHLTPSATLWAISQWRSSMKKYSKDFKVLNFLNYYWRSRCLVFDWFVCMCLFFWPRLPATDDCGGDNYSSHVSFPVAACLCSYSPGFSPTFLRCSCPILDGLAFQWLGWPVKTGAASRGKRNVELGCWCLWPWYRIWERRALGWAHGGIAKFIFFLENVNNFPGKK